jgi:hypothetical protein
MPDDLQRRPVVVEPVQRGVQEGRGGGVPLPGVGRERGRFAFPPECGGEGRTVGGEGSHVFHSRG